MTLIDTRSGLELDLVASRAQRFQQLAGVVRAARLECQLDSALAHVQWQPLAQVLDAEQVRMLLGDQVDQRGESPRPVGDAVKKRTRRPSSVS